MRRSEREQFWVSIHRRSEKTNQRPKEIPKKIPEISPFSEALASLWDALRDAQRVETDMATTDGYEYYGDVGDRITSDEFDYVDSDNRENLYDEG